MFLNANAWSAPMPSELDIIGSMPKFLFKDSKALEPGEPTIVGTFEQAGIVSLGGLKALAILYVP
jgi:hypothetical protein